MNVAGHGISIDEKYVYFINEHISNNNNRNKPIQPISNLQTDTCISGTLISEETIFT